MDHTKSKRDKARKSRVMRIRKKLRGTAEKPRLSVSKTNQHIYAQLIDDEKSVTLGGVGTLSKGLPKTLQKKSLESAKEVGKLIAELAKQKKIETVVFDRGRYKYHGIVAALAESAREAGLQF